MPLRTKLQIAMTLLATAGATVLAARHGSGGWLPFWLLLVVVILSSGFKVALPHGGDGTMSLTFPFILLGIVQLSPFQAMILAALSVAAQARVRVDKLFTAIQIAFNVANAMLSTACATCVFIALQQLRLSTAPALSLSALAYFLCNTITLSSVLASSKGESAVQLWRSEFPWYLPFYLVGAALAALVHWMSYRFGWGTALLLIPVVYTLYRAYMGQITHIQERQRHLEETEALQLRTIEGLAMAIEAKDQNTHDHLFRVRHYVKAVAEELKLSKLEKQALETAAFLHDIGKLAVPEHIINKPGKLTPEEFEKMKIHPSVGADILERVRFPYPVVPIVRSHHEWWNGTGYPDGLQGEAIPIGARVLTVVDCFDALVSDRPYRKGLSGAEALDMIRGLSGRQFDPAIVSAFEKCHAEAEVKLASLALAAFTPLNLAVDVSRGPAPGAGFEAESTSQEPPREEPANDVQKHGRATAATVELFASAADREERVPSFTGHSDSLKHLPGPIAALVLDLGTRIPFHALGIYLRQPESLELLFRYTRQGPSLGYTSVPLGEGITGWVAQNGKPIFNGNAAVEPGCPLLAMGKPAFCSGLSIPLFDKQAEAFAVLTLYAAESDFFLRDHLRLLLKSEGEFSDAVQKHLAAPESVSIAEGHSPTLATSEEFFLAFEEQIEVATDQHQHRFFAVCTLHPSARCNDDSLRCKVSRVVQSWCRTAKDAVLITPLQASSFGILQLGPASPSGSDLMQRLRQQVSVAMKESMLDHRMSASFEIVTFPEDGSSMEELLAIATRRSILEIERTSSEASFPQLSSPVLVRRV